jgi:GntR family transcriptional regulator, gluconate operon transcriptional repressor
MALMTNAETVASGAATLWQGAAEAVRLAIVSGELQDGVRASEASLAETLGVSRAPVRDAIRVLLREGLLQQGAWATTVVGCSTEDIRRLFDLRAYLEAYAIKLGAARVDEAACEELRAAADQMITAAGRDDANAYAGADLAFHRALVRAARDRWLLSAWENLAPVIAATLALGANPSSRAPQAIAAGHRDILQFLLEGDVLSAEATLRRRLRGAVDHLLTRFQAPDP